jgi:hypothetical protein
VNPNRGELQTSVQKRAPYLATGQTGWLLRDWLLEREEYRTLLLVKRVGCSGVGCWRGKSTVPCCWSNGLVAQGLVAREGRAPYLATGQTGDLSDRHSHRCDCTPVQMSSTQAPPLVQSNRPQPQHPLGRAADHPHPGRLHGHAGDRSILQSCCYAGFCCVCRPSGACREGMGPVSALIESGVPVKFVDGPILV